MGSRIVQLKEPDHQFLTPGDEWLSPPGTPFFHKVWTGPVCGWSTGALGEPPEEALEKEPEKEPEEVLETSEGPEDGAVTDSGETNGETEESEDEHGDETEVSDSDGDDEEPSGEPEPQPVERGKRKGVRKRGKGK